MVGNQCCLLTTSGSLNRKSLNPSILSSRGHSQVSSWVWLSVWMCMSYLVSLPGCIPPHILCSWNRLWVHLNPVSCAFIFGSTSINVSIGPLIRTCPLCASWDYLRISTTILLHNLWTKAYILFVLPDFVQTVALRSLSDDHVSMFRHMTQVHC